MPDSPVVAASGPLEALIAAVQESAKYRDVAPDLIRRIGLHELAVRRSLKEAIKETKNTLHQIGGAYLDAKMRYADWLLLLQSAANANSLPSDTYHPNSEMASRTTLRPRTETLHSHRTRTDAEIVSPLLSEERAEQGAGLGVRISPQAFQQACIEIMAHHASTRERLPILPEFYATLLGAIAHEHPIRSVLDVACGLNPLAIAYMPLAPNATYYACDIFGDMTRFLNDYFALADVNGKAWTADVIGSPPTQSVDVALVLKVLPVLEQAERESSLRLLRALNAAHIVVSFPTRSLGGRGKGMAEHYGARFQNLIAAETWRVRTIEFPGELCFIVTKS